MKAKKNEKKLELKKITLANLINQEMGKVRGGCTNLGSSDWTLGSIFPECSAIGCPP